MSFEDILNKRADQVEAPKPLPVGSYVGMIDTAPAKIDKEKGTVTFGIKILQAKEDVDETALADFGPVQGKMVFHTLWMLAREEGDKEAQARADYRNKKFFVDVLGLDENSNFGSMIAQAPGRQLLFTIKHVPSKDGTEMYANIAATAKLV